MTPVHITQLIIEYRYIILIPLLIIEGPIVAFVAGTLASLGYFNIYALTAVVFLRDMVLDGSWYALGYWGGRTAFARRMLSKIKITEDHIDSIRVLWDEKPARTMLIGKLSYGISGAFIVVAGMVKMPIVKFFKYGALAMLVQYGSLLALGYFFGVAYGSSLTGIIQNIQYVIAIGSLVLVIFYSVSWYMRRKFMKEEKEAEEEVEKGAGMKK